MGAPVLTLLLVTGVLSRGPWLVAADSGNARATYYGGSDASGTWSGNCGYAQVYPPASISLPSAGYGVFVAAGSPPLYNGGLGCGACYRVKCINSGFCKGGSVVVTITDLCPGGEHCGTGAVHFDLSQPAFNQIAQEVAGVIDISYERVDCQNRAENSQSAATKLTNGVKITSKGSDYYLSVILWNVAGKGTVRKVEAKAGGGGWVQLRHDWGASWVSNGYLQASSGVDFRIQNEFGETLTIIGCGGQPSGSGVSYQCAGNFPTGGGGGGSSSNLRKRAQPRKSTVRRNPIKTYTKPHQRRDPKKDKEYYKKLKKLQEKMKKRAKKS